ncbi:MAG: hypothetical protein J6S31_07310 [Lachnospiraceae bacterium]|nr:hypothetical protein [Lachnospiraceae bacterium]
MDVLLLKFLIDNDVVKWEDDPRENVEKVVSQIGGQQPDLAKQNKKEIQNR